MTAADCCADPLGIDRMVFLLRVAAGRVPGRAGQIAPEHPDDHGLSTDQTTAIVLLVNEAAINAAKHVFRKGRPLDCLAKSASKKVPTRREAVR